MRENVIQEQYQSGQINVLHIAGKNQSIRYIYKGDKSTEHFQETRDSVMIIEENFDIADNQTLPPHHKQRITMEKS